MIMSAEDLLKALIDWYAQEHADTGGSVHAGDLLIYAAKIAFDLRKSDDAIDYVDIRLNEYRAGRV